jgi:tetratricopeptide (TPR) repeat protein
MRHAPALVAVWLIGTSCTLSLAAQGTGKAPWQRQLQGDDARKAKELEQRLEELEQAGQFETAAKVAQELVDLHESRQGADHWQAVGARQEAEAVRRVLRQTGEVRRAFAGSFALQRQANVLKAQGRYREAGPLLGQVLAARRTALGEDHPETARGYNGVAFNLHNLGQYRQAEPVYEKALAILRQTLGEDHPDTAACWNNLAGNLSALGRYREAEENYRKSLDIRRRALGEGHPSTARGYHNLAHILDAQGCPHEAEPLLRRALDVWRRALGEENIETARGYNDLAANLQAQGRFTEAQEGFRKALDVFRKTLGEEHPLTATGYNNLAANLDEQGRCPDAENSYRRALAILRKVLGEEHPETATAYANLGANLNEQGRYREAEELCRKAVDLERNVLGPEHPETTHGYDVLAGNLQDQGRYREAEEIFRKSLDVCRKTRGEDDPLTALAYDHLAQSLRAQGQFRQAEEGSRKALDGFRKALGEDNPRTARAYGHVAATLHAQGNYADAEDYGRRAADRFARARLRIAASGLGRATKTAERSPLPALAAVLARNGKAEEAWQRFEESLGRGAWDDLSARLRRPAAEQARQAELTARLEQLDRQIEQTLAAGEDTPERKRRREELLGQRRAVQEELSAFAGRLEETYGPAAGKVFDRATVQAALPADSALVGWLDLTALPGAADPNGEHWAVLLRSAGEPTWVRLPGCGPGGGWTEEDNRLATALRAALQEPRGDWRDLAGHLRRQRLGPLDKHLGGVRRLIVLPSAALAGLPVEVFAEGYTVCYALSGTLHAHLHHQEKPATQGLLALADPAFNPPAAGPPPPLPERGVLLSAVLPGGNAALSRLRPNDVLLRYAGKDLAGPADLELASSDDPDKRIPVTVWRDGKTFEVQVRPGKLGAVLAREPAPRALAERHRLDQQMAAARDEPWAVLPGTRVEVESLRGLFGDKPAPLVLLGSQASEQRLYELARRGALAGYRYVHLATHGEAANSVPLRSAILLARDQLPDPARQLEAGLPVFDGRLTAEEVLQQWRLDAELVTLSACQSALGKYERGEGFVGFAQAFVLCGSRAVCLSLWPVDDAATALLMERFYANLLGRRQGLDRPLPKAEALAEARAWLRSVSAEEAARRSAGLRGGLARAKGRPTRPAPQSPSKSERPFDHPYYWAAFVLIGDPD